MYNGSEVKRDDIGCFLFLCAFILVIAFTATHSIRRAYPSKEYVEVRKGNFPESALYIGSVVQHRSNGASFVISSIHNSYCVSLRNPNTYLDRVNIAELEPVTDVKQE